MPPFPSLPVHIILHALFLLTVVGYIYYVYMSSDGPENENARSDVIVLFGLHCLKVIRMWQTRD